MNKQKTIDCFVLIYNPLIYLSRVASVQVKISVLEFVLILFCIIGKLFYCISLLLLIIIIIIYSFCFLFLSSLSHSSCNEISSESI